jgi:hypothetical protein
MVDHSNSAQTVRINRASGYAKEIDVDAPIDFGFLDGHAMNVAR